MRIGFVCVNYNNADITRHALQTFLRTAPEGTPVVVDNFSRPEEVEKLRRLARDFPAAMVLYSDENVGYFRGLNLGITALRARDSSLDLMVVGNNDLEFPEAFLGQVNAVRDILRSHPVLSPDVVTVDGIHQNPHVISSISWKRELAYDLFYSNYQIAKFMLKVARLTHRYTARDDEKHWRTPRSIHQGHGSCYILGPVFFRHFTELWAPTFMMSEEYFLSRQLSDRGMCVYYEPSIRVIHQYHASVGQIPARKMWMLANDAHRVYRKYVKVFK